MPIDNKKNETLNISFLQKQNIVHALAYFPFFVGAISMYALAKTNKEALMHHVKYSLILSVFAVILLLLLNWYFQNIAVILYIWLSVYFAFKAFKGQAIEVEFLDVIEEKIEETFKK